MVIYYYYYSHPTILCAPHSSPVGGRDAHIQLNGKCPSDAFGSVRPLRFFSPTVLWTLNSDMLLFSHAVCECAGSPVEAMFWRDIRRYSRGYLLSVHCLYCYCGALWYRILIMSSMVNGCPPALYKGIGRFGTQPLNFFSYSSSLNITARSGQFEWHTCCKI